MKTETHNRTNTNDDCWQKTKQKFINGNYIMFEVVSLNAKYCMWKYSDRMQWEITTVRNLETNEILELKL